MDALVAALGSKVITDPNRLPAYQHDRAYDPHVVPPRAVVVAESTADVAATLRWANENGAPVIIRGWAQPFGAVPRTRRASCCRWRNLPISPSIPLTGSLSPARARSTPM